MSRVYEDSPTALKNLQPHESNDLLAQEVHFRTLVSMHLTTQLREASQCSAVQKRIDALCHDEEQLAKFETYLTSSKSDSLYRRAIAQDRALCVHVEKLKSK